MKLHEFKLEIRDQLRMAQDFWEVKLAELPETNLFKWLIAPDYDYHHLDVEFSRVRIANARQVEIANLEDVLGGGSDVEAVMAIVEPKQCFQNAWRLSLYRQWDYCEGYFTEARYGHLIGHAWNRT